MDRRRAVTVLALLALTSVSAWAQQGPQLPGPPPPPGGGPMRLEFVLRALELTSEQSAVIDPLLETRREVAEAARTGTEAARRALAEQVRAETFDEAAIRAKAAAVATLDADRAVADAALLRDVRAVLTPEQRGKLDRLLGPPLPPPPGGGTDPGRSDSASGKTSRPIGRQSR